MGRPHTVSRPEGISVFVAWRELRFARGRFLLIGAVVALITLLVGFLSGLTGGLAAQNVSAVLQLPGDRLVLQQPGEGDPAFGSSSLDDDAVRAWSEAEGVRSVVPVGIAQSPVEPAAGEPAPGADAAGADTAGADTAGADTAGADPSRLALFGLPRETGAAGTNPLLELAPAHEDEVGLSAGAAEALGVAVGDAVVVTGERFTVASVGEDLWYSHSPVAVMPPEAWAAASERVGGTGEATVLAVTGEPDWDAVSAATGTAAETPLASLTALEAFKSEIGSLGLMIAMLFGISALVVGAFFTVWTMQRAGDVAVLKALGATTGSLVRDALGQALVVLVAGIGAGLAAVVGLGALAAQALPFVVSPLTTAAPAAVMAALGLAGAAFALRSVTRADPLTALGSHR